MDRKRALVLVDVQGPWARSNPVTTKRIIDAANALRGQLTIVWLVMNYETQKNNAPLLGGDATPLLPEDDHYRVAFQPDPRDWVVSKTRRDGFSNNELPDFLDHHDISRIHMGGFRTAQCVFDTAVSAAMGRRVSLLSDLTSNGGDRAPSENDLHNFTRRGITLADCSILGL